MCVCVTIGNVWPRLSHLIQSSPDPRQQDSSPHLRKRQRPCLQATEDRDLAFRRSTKKCAGLWATLRPTAQQEVVETFTKYGVAHTIEMAGGKTPSGIKANIYICTLDPKHNLNPSVSPALSLNLADTPPLLPLNTTPCCQPTTHITTTSTVSPMHAPGIIYSGAGWGG